MSREALAVVVSEDVIGVMEFGSMLVEFHVVLANLPIVLHLEVLDSFFHVGYGVDVAIVFSESLEKLLIVIGPLEVLIKLVGIYKPGLKPLDSEVLEVVEGKVNFLVILLVLLEKIPEVQVTFKDEGCKLFWV